MLHNMYILKKLDYKLAENNSMTEKIWNFQKNVVNTDIKSIGISNIAQKNRDTLERMEILMESSGENNPIK